MTNWPLQPARKNQRSASLRGALFPRSPHRHSSVICHLSFVICHLSFVMRTSFRRVRQPQAHNDARALTWLASNLQGGTEIFGARAHIGETETLAFANHLCLRQSGAIIRDPKHKV